MSVRNLSHRVCRIQALIALIALIVGLIGHNAAMASGLPYGLSANAPSQDPPKGIERSGAGGSQPPDYSQTESGTGGSKEQDPLREQTIYIPYEKLQDIFEREGRGVFLPYEKFQELWQAARRPNQPSSPSRPPVDALIAEASHEASVVGDVMLVRSQLTIDLLQPGWNRIPLRLADAAIRSATIEGKAARVIPNPDGGYWLILERSSANESRTTTLQLEYAKAFTKSPGQNSVSLMAPLSPISRWQIRVPQSGIKLQVHPMIAASELPESSSPASDANQDPTSGSTTLQAFVGAAPEVRIEWTPKSEGAAGMEALVGLQTEQAVTIDEGVMRTRAQLHYSISRAEVQRLSIRIPSQQKVVNVFDSNLRKWEVQSQGDQQLLTMELFEPARQSQRILLELEQFLADPKQLEVTIPSLQAEQVSRQQGMVVVNVAPNLRSEPIERTALMQLDVSDLPQFLAGKPWNYIYRFATTPYQLRLRIDQVLPTMVVDQLVEAYLQPDVLTLQVLGMYSIERAGIFQLEYQLPAGFEVRHVTGRAVPGSEPVQIESYQVVGQESPRLVINLARKALGKVAVLLELQRRLNEPDLLSPTGKGASLGWTLPRPMAESLQRSAGHLVLYAPESLRITPGTLRGVRDATASEAFQGTPSVRDGRLPNLRESLIMAYTDEPAELQLLVERRKPYVGVRQWLFAKVESGVIRYQALLHYDVRYSSVKGLRLDVPSAIANRLHIDTSGVRETTLDSNPNETPEGYVAWQLFSDSEWLGNYVIQLSWEEPLDELEVGKAASFAVSRLIPQQVDRSWGQILLAKAESLDVQPAADMLGLRPIDPQHDVLQGGSIPASDVARAFEYQGDWSLRAEVTRYSLQEVKRTSIERGLVTIVSTRSRQVGVQAQYRMRTARQRLAIQLPANAVFDSQPVRIQGKSVPLERGEGDQLFIPMAGLPTNEPFLLELRYTMEGSYSELPLPTFPEDPAVQKVYVAAFVPEEQLVLGTRGPWTEEFGWSWRNSMQWIPRPNQSLNALTEWVREGLSAGNVSTFATDGTMYLFSALHPTSPPDGSLRLSAMHHKLLAGILVGLMLTLGLLLWRTRWLTKWTAIASVTGVLMFMGVQSPIFARQVLNTPFYLGCGIVGLLWSVNALQALGSGWQSMRKARPSPPIPEPTATPQADEKSIDGGPSHV